ARLWDARTGHPLAPPLRHAAGLTCVTFSPDSRWLATFSEDGAAQLWDADNGESLTAPLKHPAAVSDGCFLAGGKYLFVRCASDLTAIWELPHDARPVEDWRSLASLLAARRFNPAGFLEPLDAESLTNSWR